MRFCWRFAHSSSSLRCAVLFFCEGGLQPQLHGQCAFDLYRCLFNCCLLRGWSSRCAFDMGHCTGCGREGRGTGECSSCTTSRVWNTTMMSILTDARAANERNGTTCDHLCQKPCCKDHKAMWALGFVMMIVGAGVGGILGSVGVVVGLVIGIGVGAAMGKGIEWCCRKEELLQPPQPAQAPSLQPMAPDYQQMGH